MFPLSLHLLIFLLLQIFQFFLIHFLHGSQFLSLCLILLLVLFREFRLDNGKSQVKQEEGADKDKWDVKNEGYGWHSLHSSCHEGCPPFKGHARKDSDKGVGDRVEIHLVETRVFKGLPTEVPWRAFDVTTIMGRIRVIIKDQSSVYIDASSLK